MFGKKRKQMEADIRRLQAQAAQATDRLDAHERMIGRESSARMKEDQKLKNMIRK